MSRRDEAPIEDEFCVWFRSLSTESKREALRVAVKIRQESFGGVTITEFIADAPLHVAPIYDPVLLLN